MIESIKNGNILIMKDLYEAFNYFYSGNKNVELLASEPSVAKKHYVRQDLGNVFMYDCKKYGIKFINISEDIYLCDIVRYHVKDNNEIIDSMMNFRYDFKNNELITINSLYTPYSNLSTEEAVKVLYK